MTQNSNNPTNFVTYPLMLLLLCMLLIFVKITYQEYNYQQIIAHPIAKIETLTESDKIIYLNHFFSNHNSYQITIDPISTPGTKFTIPQKLQDHIQNLASTKFITGDKNTHLRPDFANTEISNISQIGCAISGTGILVDQSVDPKIAVLGSNKIPTIPWTAYIKF